MPTEASLTRKTSWTELCETVPFSVAGPPEEQLLCLSRVRARGGNGTQRCEETAQAVIERAACLDQLAPTKRRRAARWRARHAIAQPRLAHGRESCVGARGGAVWKRI
eukprot:4906598-Pleurochrysis_carterae.AAC.1